MRTFKALFTAAICIAIVGFGISSFMGGCMPNYSDGERTGVVVKMSKKGVFVKNWEGTLHLGTQNSATGANSWDFSVRDEATASALRDSQETGKVLNIHYHQWAVKPFTIDTPYEIDRVK